MRLSRLLLAAALLAGFVSSPNAPARAQENDVPRFESAECAPFPGVDVECGYLVVPEDRSQPGGPTIRLAVATFKALGQNAVDDPLIYLTGGPGGHLLQQAPGLASALTRLLRNRDIVMFDQRGVGFSEPSLDCPEMDADFYDALDENLSSLERGVRQVTAARVCRDRLAGQGVDLAAYTSAANAADVNDLRLVLGYEQVNLFGVSYGSRLALTVMRDFPESVRSVILDSVYPPQVSLPEGVPGNAERAFETLFAGCAADTNCSRNYPDLEAVFYTLVDRLNESPIGVRVRDPLQNRDLGVVLTGDQLVENLFELLYQTDLIPLLPRAIWNLSGGDARLLALMLSQTVATPHFISEGAYYSIECADEGPFSTVESVAAAATGVEPRLRLVFENQAQQYLGICAGWGAGAVSAIENEPVVSDIPTLVLSGQYDPITPPEWGQQAAGSLSHSYFYEFAGIGHGVIFSHPCPLNMAHAFLSDPTAVPNAACVDRLDGPDFE